MDIYKYNYIIGYIRRYIKLRYIYYNIILYNIYYCQKVSFTYNH